MASFGGRDQEHTQLQRNVAMSLNPLNIFYQEGIYPRWRVFRAGFSTDKIIFCNLKKKILPVVLLVVSLTWRQCCKGARSHSHRTQNNGIHRCEGVCSHNMEAASKDLQANLHVNLLTPPVWMEPNSQNDHAARHKKWHQLAHVVITVRMRKETHLVCFLQFFVQRFHWLSQLCKFWNKSSQMSQLQNQGRQAAVVKHTSTFQTFLGQKVRPNTPDEQSNTFRNSPREEISSLAHVMNIHCVLGSQEWDQVMKAGHFSLEKSKNKKKTFIYIRKFFAIKQNEPLLSSRFPLWQPTLHTFLIFVTG